ACERYGRDPSTLRRSLLLWSADADPWKAKGAFERLIERFAPLGFSDFVALMPRPEHSDVLDHFTDTVSATTAQLAKTRRCDHGLADWKTMVADRHVHTERPPRTLGDRRVRRVWAIHRPCEDPN